MTGLARAIAAASACAALAATAGCGFIAAGGTSVRKPSSFVLLGRADVALPASDHAAVGTTCLAPASISGIAENTPVTVIDSNGVKVAHGSLGSGILGRAGSTTTCSFPFQIPAVPGNSSSYGIAVGGRPAQTFAASPLRQNTPAVVTISR